MSRRWGRAGAAGGYASDRNDGIKGEKGAGKASLQSTEKGGGKGKAKGAKGAKGQSSKGKGGGKNSSKGGNKPTDAPDFFWAEPGTPIGDFEVVSLLGTGTFSRVFKVAHRSGKDKIEYAAKVMEAHSQYIQYESDGQKEAERLEWLQRDDSNDQHGTLRILSHFALEHNGAPYRALVLEMLECSLHDFVKRNRYRGFSIRVVQEMARQLISTLNFLHSRRLTHTDIKHKNTMMRSGAADEINDASRWPLQVQRAQQTDRSPYLQPRDTLVKFIDYGNATLADEPHCQPIHTKQFRAPECLCSKEWSENSDTWCLACTLYFVYAGDLLFNTHDTQEHMAKIDSLFGPFPAWLSSKRFSSSPGTGDLSGICSEHKGFESLLRAMFVVDPRERGHAKELLTHSFLKDPPPDQRRSSCAQAADID